jgi:hypothetical protein
VAPASRQQHIVATMHGERFVIGILLEVGWPGVYQRD